MKDPVNLKYFLPAFFYMILIVI